MYSYGAWYVLAAFLGILDFTRMQLLNHYAYRTGVPRCLPKWRLPPPSKTKMTGQTCVYNVDLETGDWTTTEDPRFDFRDGMSVFALGKLLFFKGGRQVKVTGYSRLDIKYGMVKTELPQLHYQLEDFAICTVHERYVILTGGSSGR